MRKIYLHGHLAQFGDEFEMEVSTAAEALRALNANFPGFLKLLEKGSYHVVRGDPDDGYGLDEEEVREFKLGQADLHFIPVIEGAKSGNSGGILKTILGVVLIGVAVFMSGGALGAALGTGMLSGVTWGNVAMIGLGLAVAGASQLLTPQDKTDDKNESYSLSGPVNTYNQGSPIPVIYGQVITGGHVISAGVDIEQLKKYGEQPKAATNPSEVPVEGEHTPWDYHQMWGNDR